MTRTALWMVSLLLFSVAGQGKSDLDLNEATKEVLDILRNPDLYDNGVMAHNASGPINTEIQLFFREVDVDDIKMRIQIDMTFRMIWTDPRLQYKTQKVPYVTITEPELAWFPDPFFKHAISTQQQNTILPQNYLRVYRSGKVVFSTRLIVLFSCSMDFSRFPHDRQHCNIPIASYGYTIDDLVFRFAEDKPIMYREGAMHSTNFLVDGFLTDKCDSKTATGVYSCVEVVLRLNRRVTSYVMEWFIPCILLVVVAGMSEVVIATEFLPRVLLTLIPLITLCTYSGVYALLTTSSVPYVRPLDIFSGISFLVIFCQLIRIIILHYYAQRKIKEENGELLPRHPRDDFLETIIVNADTIAKITLLAFYILFLLCYFLAYST